MNFDSNIDEVMAQLRQKADRAVEAAERELQLSALEVEAKAKQNAPVDTGMLRGSITSTGSGSEYEIGTNLEYAPFVEFGTRYMAAQPFLLPAFDEVVKNLQANIMKAVMNIMRG